MFELEECLRIYRDVRGRNVSRDRIPGRTRAEVDAIIAHVDSLFHNDVYTCSVLATALMHPLRPRPWPLWDRILWGIGALTTVVLFVCAVAFSLMNMAGPREQPNVDRQSLQQPQPAQQRGKIGDSPRFSTLKE